MPMLQGLICTFTAKAEIKSCNRLVLYLPNYDHIYTTYISQCWLTIPVFYLALIDPYIPFSHDTNEVAT